MAKPTQTETTPGPIIIVDDDRHWVRWAVQGLRQHYGMESVLGTTDALTAESWLKEQRPTALITDLRMPLLSGLELASRARTRWGAVPVIVVTAYPLAELERKADNRLFFYLTKPCEIEALTAIINGLSKPGENRFRGMMEASALADLLQWCAMTGHTGALAVKTPDGREGRAWIDNGQLLHAEAEGLSGEAAFAALVGWSEGSFQWLREPAPLVTIDIPLTEALLDALLRGDEQSAAASASAFRAVGVRPADAPRIDVAALASSVEALQALAGFVGVTVRELYTPDPLYAAGAHLERPDATRERRLNDVFAMALRHFKTGGGGEELTDVMLTFGERHHMFAAVGRRLRLVVHVELQRYESSTAAARVALTTLHDRLDPLAP